MVNSVRVPADYTLTTMTEVSNSISFYLVVEDPCLSTQLLQFLVDDLVSYSQSTPVTLVIPPVSDLVSQRLGSGLESFCGPPAFEVLPAGQFILIQAGSQLVFDSS